MKKFLIVLSVLIVLALPASTFGAEPPQITGLRITDVDEVLPDNVVRDDEGDGTETSRFNFAATGATRVDCAVDDGAFFSCSNGTQKSGVAVGVHTAHVVARSKRQVTSAQVEFVVCSQSGANDPRCPGFPTPPPPPPPPPSAQCADLLDNDADTLIDFPADPGCVDAADNDEADPPPPPPPPVNECTSELAVGGDLSSFAATIGAGEVGCLRGGTYTDGTTVTWSVDASPVSRAVLTSYPGETAEIVGTELLLSGDNLTVKDIVVRDVLHTDGDGISASGTGDRIEHNLVRHVARNGILLHTDSRNAIVTRSFVDDVGWNSSMLPSQAHGIYCQGIGHDITRNVFVRMQGYGIHCYSSSGSSNLQPADIDINGNTTLYSVHSSGIVVRSGSGGNIRVFNNVSAFNIDNGINYYTGTNCPTGPCVIDTNLVFGNSDGNYNSGAAARATNTIVADPLFADAEYRLMAFSPAIDVGRSDSVFPDRDGIPAMQGLGPDLGAYER